MSSLEELQQAVASRPSVTTLFNLGREYSRLGFHDLCIQTFTIALQAPGTSNEVRAAMMIIAAKSFSKLDDKERCIALHLQSVATYPEAREPRIELALALIHWGGENKDILQVIDSGLETKTRITTAEFAGWDALPYELAARTAFAENDQIKAHGYLNQMKALGLEPVMGLFG